jgi:hypothetical protein
MNLFEASTITCRSAGARASPRSRRARRTRIGRTDLHRSAARRTSRCACRRRTAAHAGDADGAQCAAHQGWRAAACVAVRGAWGACPLRVGLCEPRGTDDSTAPLARQQETDRPPAAARGCAENPQVGRAADGLSATYRGPPRGDRQTLREEHRGRNLDGPVRRGGVVGQVQRHPHAGCAGRGASRRRRPAVGEHPRRVSLERASGTLSSHVVLRQQTACPALRRVGASSCWQAVFELSAAAKSFVVLAGSLSQASAASGPLTLPEARSSGLKEECVARRSAARLPIPRVVSPCVRGSELMWGSDGRWLSRLTAVRSASEESGEKHVQGARDDEG